ncbi:hypothetical protein FKM82_019906 [Ascaphus truei]
MGVIRECRDVRWHLSLTASQTFKELAMVRRGICIPARLFWGSQIRFLISIGEQHSFSNATHLRRFGSVCHCTTWLNCAAL